MSHEIVRSAYRTKLGNSTAKSVLAILADAVNEEGFGWPSVPYMADRTELSERQVLRVLQVFEEIALVSRIRQRTARYRYAFQINLGLLEADLSDVFRAAFQHAQRKGSVSETSKSVSETGKGVSETLPPYPLYGGTVNEPLRNHPQPPQRGGFAKGQLSLGLASMRAVAVSRPVIWQAVDQVMQGCGFSRKRLRLRIAAAMQLELDKGAEAPTVALAMIAAWKDQEANGDLLEIVYGADKFFGDGYWRKRETWRWDQRRVEQGMQARVGMVQ